MGILTRLGKEAEGGGVAEEFTTRQKGGAKRSKSTGGDPEKRAPLRLGPPESPQKVDDGEPFGEQQAEQEAGKADRTGTVVSDHGERPR
jgi:hypothetical protein